MHTALSPHSSADAVFESEVNGAIQNLTCKSLLTITQNCGIITTKDKEKVTLQTGKETIMKKATLQSLVNYLNGETVTNLDEIKAEIEAELNKGMEAKAANDAVYEQAKPVVMKILDKLTAPAPLSEIYAEAEAALPEGFTKGKFQYAMTRLWTDEVVKIEGKPNCYKKA
jgi:hypothetical protein